MSTAFNKVFIDKSSLKVSSLTQCQVFKIWGHIIWLLFVSYCVWQCRITAWWPIVFMLIYQLVVWLILQALIWSWFWSCLHGVALWKGCQIKVAEALMSNAICCHSSYTISADIVIKGVWRWGIVWCWRLLILLGWMISCLLWPSRHCSWG